MAPEYAMEGLFSVKSDVFSFGVLVLEILSGKKNNRFYVLGNAQSLLQYVRLLSPCLTYTISILGMSIYLLCHYTDLAIMERRKRIGGIRSTNA